MREQSQSPVKSPTTVAIPRLLPIFPHVFWNNMVSNLFHGFMLCETLQTPISPSSSSLLIDHSWREIGGGRNIFVTKSWRRSDTTRKAPPPYLVDGTGPQVVGGLSGLLTITDPDSDTYPYPDTQYIF